MDATARCQRVFAFLTLLTVFMLPLISWADPNGRQIVSGPYSLSVRGGAENSSAALGFDGRVDYLNELLNIHLFGTFDWLSAGSGEGAIDNKRYGAGFALSHTFAKQANIYAGTSMSREMGENFGHAYLGGKVKVTDFALLSASYGFGFGPERSVINPDAPTTYVGAEAKDWFKTGVVLVEGHGLKANAYYVLTDPGNLQSSGVEGELSYPILDNLTIGINGSRDLTSKGNLDRNWRSFAFVTYAFGSQKGSPIDVALDKNQPSEYARIHRVVHPHHVTPITPPEIPTIPTIPTVPVTPITPPVVTPPVI